MAGHADAQRLAEENGRTLEALLARLQALNAKIATPPAVESTQEARLAAAEYELVMEAIYKQQSELIARKQKEHAEREAELKRLLGQERAFSNQLRSQVLQMQSAHQSLLAVLKLHLGQGDDEAYERKVRELARTDPGLRVILTQPPETEA